MLSGEVCRCWSAALTIISPYLSIVLSFFPPLCTPCLLSVSNTWLFYHFLSGCIGGQHWPHLCRSMKTDGAGITSGFQSIKNKPFHLIATLSEEVRYTIFYSTLLICRFIFLPRLTELMCCIWRRENIIVWKHYELNV